MNDRSVAQVVDEIKNNVRLSRLRADAGQQHDQQCTNPHALFCAERGSRSRSELKYIRDI